MAGFRVALKARHLAAGPVAAIVADRIFWGDTPQKTPLPYVVLTVVSDPREQHLKGEMGGRWTRVQADCRGRTDGEANALALAVKNASLGPGTFDGHVFGMGRAEGPRTLNEQLNDQTIHREVMDLFLWHVGD